MMPRFAMMIIFLRCQHASRVGRKYQLFRDADADIANYAAGPLGTCRYRPMKRVDFRPCVRGFHFAGPSGAAQSDALDMPPIQRGGRARRRASDARRAIFATR